MSERHARLLAAFAERAARLAADLADRALEAETPEDAARLTQAFHVAGRSLRQAIALEQRLERDAARAQREDAAQADIRQARDVEARKGQLRKALRPLAWTEAEALDVSDLDELDAEQAFHDHVGERIEVLEDALEAAAEDAAAFLAEPLPAQIERLAKEAGLGDLTPARPGDREAAARSSQGRDPGTAAASAVHAARDFPAPA